ncbi:MAG: hypothetical protein LC674_04925, partial [Actinobacteria bacterium]|nr:hypothetical protein [Actinomycetota bacterium]
YRSVAQKQSLIDQYRQSGLTRAAWCRQQRLSYTLFSRWLAKSAAPGEPVLKEVSLSELFPGNAAGCLLEVDLPNGTRLKLNQMISPGVLGELVRQLKKAC